MPHLPPETISTLHTTAVELGLPNNRSALLSHIPQTTLANIPSDASTPAAQLLLDLNALNQLPSASALQIWLDNAITLHAHDERAKPLIDAKEALANVSTPSPPMPPASSPARMPLVIAALLALPLAVFGFQFCHSPTPNPNASNPSTPEASTPPPPVSTAEAQLSPPSSSPSSSPAAPLPQSAAAQAPAAPAPSGSVQIKNDVRNIHNKGQMEAGNIDVPSNPGTSIAIDNKVDGVTGEKGSTSKVGNVTVH